MKLALDPQTVRLIDEYVKSGRFATCEEVVTAALLALEQREEFGDLAEAELDALVAEGEVGTSAELLDGDSAASARRERRRNRQT